MPLQEFPTSRVGGLWEGGGAVLLYMLLACMRLPVPMPTLHD
jgi:hypothetical protein